jgi:TolB-like protein/DNA-binding winged helix-turn-helix (wHTH) protein/Flp pilus assembly protein TadD
MEEAMDTDFHVGPWLVEPSLNTVSRNRRSLRLEPKVMEVLVCLARQPGESVSKDQLLRTVWPHTFVSDDVLIRSISELRRVFEDDAREAKVIQTIAKRGYRLVLPVRPVDRTDASPQPVDAPVSGPEPRQWRLRAGIVAGGVALPLVLLLGWNPRGLRQRLLGGEQPPSIRSIAVLPLENLSGDPSQDYFADGMTDELITDLGQISALRVISRTSVMQYKGAHKSLPQIARELNVDAVVEGTVLRSGDRVRITAQLIQAAVDKHIWAQSYEGSVREVLNLQDEVAQAIANEIRAKLTPQEQARLSRGRAINPEVHELYLQGRYFWNKRTAKSLEKAIAYFQRIIELDPGYAPAYAGLADCYGILPSYSNFPSREADQKAIAAATKALELDPNLAEPYATLASSGPYRWDWSAAQKNFERALELDPNYATAHQWYGECLQQMGHLDEATAEFGKAYELDPLSPAINAVAAYQSYVLRDFDRATEQYLKLLDLDPNYAEGHFGLGQVYEAQGMYGKAIAEFQAARSLDQSNPLRLSFLGHAYGVAGRRKDARNELRELNALAKQQSLSAFHFAVVHMGLGENEQAFGELNKAWEERYWMMSLLKVDPIFDSLRADPRFNALVHRIGLPEL